MSIAAIVEHTRTRCWPVADAGAALKRQKRNAYSCRYRREVYRKKRAQRSVTLSLLQDRRLCAAADLHGRKPAAFLREAAFAYLDRGAVLPAMLQEGLAALTLEVRRIGTNINQLARQANTRSATAPAAFQRAVALLAELEAAPARFLPTPPVPPSHAR